MYSRSIPTPASFRIYISVTTPKQTDILTRLPDDWTFPGTAPAINFATQIHVIIHRIKTSLCW